MLDSEKNDLRIKLSPKNSVNYMDHFFSVCGDGGIIDENMEKRIEVMDKYLLLLTRYLIKKEVIFINDVIDMVDDAQLL
ncbi:MAG: hypothetical protein ABIH76_04655 [Candidatus Bathyarchaeota archaeon]